MKKQTKIKIGVAIAVVLAFILIEPLRTGLQNMMKNFGSVDDVRNYILSFGGWAVAVSFLMMVLQSVAAPIPAFVITFANAMVWGWQKGAILSWTSSMAGAALCFFLSRVYGRGLAEKLVSKFALEEVDGFFDRYGKNTIFVARLLPFVPFDPISYAAGLTPMSFGGFFLATGLGQLPATIVYSYAAAKSTNPSTFVQGLLILFGVVGAGYLAKLIYNERQKKRKEKNGSV